MTHTATPPFHTAIIFSGGGLRFGYYLGMYQALCDNDKTPDLILASCGGAFAAGLLEVSDCPQQAYERMLGYDCYTMLRRITPNLPRHRTDYVFPALGRWLASQAGRVAKKLPAPIDIVSNQLMFLQKPVYRLSEQTLDLLTKQSLTVIENESESHPFWQFSGVKAGDKKPINTVILASQLLPIDQHHQWQLLLRCSNSPLSNTLEPLNLTNIMATYNPTKIHAKHAIIENMSLAIAVRASVSDMFYLPPITWQGRNLMGGVLNLTPIELACNLANKVYAETKAGYDRLLAEPAIQAVYGFSPNQRLDQVHQFSPHNSQIHWIDTSDNAKHIRPAIAKKIRLSKGYLDVVRPDFATYQRIMHQQFDYGYQKTLQYLDGI